MKTIEPVKTWYNGAEIVASVISAVIQSDNLKDTATFQYQLITLIPIGEHGLLYPSPVASNYLTITGEDYEKWDSNDYAYNWIAQQLNLTITGEYVPPVPPNPAVPAEPTTTTTTTIS